MNSPTITEQQELSLTRCDAWLDEFDLLLARIRANEPVYRPLSPLWETTEQQQPVIREPTEPEPRGA